MCTQTQKYTQTHTQLSNNKGTPGLAPGEGPDDLPMAPGDSCSEHSSLLIQGDTEIKQSTVKQSLTEEIYQIALSTGS